MVAVLLLISALSLVACASAACTNVEPMEKFDLSKLEGVWYEWSSLRPFSLFQIHTCHAMKFYIGTDKKSATVVHGMAYQVGEEMRINSKWHIMHLDSAPNGKLVAKLKTLMFGYEDYPLLVVDTDYTNYLIFFICKQKRAFDLRDLTVAFWQRPPICLAEAGSTEYNEISTTVGYIMTRKNSYNTEEIDAIDKDLDAAMTKIHRKREDFTIANQENCTPAKFSEKVKVTPATEKSRK